MIFIPQVSTPNGARRGVILLVVIALLTLFASVGLSFVFYAEAESAASQLNRESASLVNPDVSPELLLSYFLGQLIYDTDDTNGVYSALRGHSLARNAWGYNCSLVGTTYYMSPNGIPFTGIGRAAADNNVNYIYYPTDGKIYDPERGGQTRVSSSAAQANAFIPGNVAYTYPDRNNMILGAVNGNGEVLIQSCYRPWMETAGNKYTYLRPDSPADSATPWNPNFSTPDRDGGGHVKNLENSPGTVYYSGGTKLYYMNDSWWIDLGFPVQTAPNGRKFKPLFAAFVTDMDNKLNVNAHGNMRAYTNTHASSLGLGPWEVNLNKVLTQNDWTNIFVGNTSTKGRYYTVRGTSTGGNTANTLNDTTQAWGANQWQCQQVTIVSGTGVGQTAAVQGNTATQLQTTPAWVTIPDKTSVYLLWSPAKPGTAGSTYTIPPIYSWFDLDGAQTGTMNPSTKYVAPGENQILGATKAKPIQITATNHGFATGDTINVYGVQGNTAANGTWTITYVDQNSFTLDTSDGTASGAYTAGTGIASPYPSFFGFPYYNAASFGNGQANEVLNHPAVYNVFDPNYNSPAGGLRIFNWSNIEALLRYQGTNSPGQTSDLFGLCPLSLNPASFPKTAWLLTPHSFDFGRPGATPWMYPNAGNSYQLAAGASYPQLSTATGISTPAFPVSPNNGEFGLDWRGLAGAQGLNSGSGTQSVGALLRRLDLNRALTTYATSATQAIKDRQQFAKDIFDRLRLVTTGNWPGDPFPAAGTQYNALQWLAQLAVNIVDYIDGDNNVTPWQWDTTNATSWVYGTEIPRLVINEVYSEVINDPTDPFTGGRATLPYKVNFWVELLNPLRDDGANSYDQTLQDANKAIYELVIGTPAAVSADPTSAPPNMKLDVTNYKDATGALAAVVKPAGANYSGPNGSNQGFYVVGPTDTFPGAGPPPIPQATVKVQWGASAAVVAAGGTGYAVGDTITLAGGTFAAGQATVLTVTTVTAGAVTGISITNPGSYTAVPPNPVSQGSSSGGGTGATFTMTWNNRMFYPLPVGAPIGISHNVYLRRLACPTMAFNNNTADPLYNPYITIDYASNNPLNDALTNDANGAHAPTPVDQRYSVGRRQPYAAYYNGNWSLSQVVGAGRPLITNATKAAPIQITFASHGFVTGNKVVINGVQGNTAANGTWTITVVDANNFTLNTSDGTASGAYVAGTGLVYNQAYYNATQPQHTFFRHNALESAAPPSSSTAGQTLQVPFDWLVQLDRSVSSPIDIMQASAYPPHLLTQRFMLQYGTNQRFQHLAGVAGNPIQAWTGDQTSLLYRLFEFLEIGSVAAGVSKDKGRIPGLINLNNVWDVETLQALADPQALSRFSAADIATTFNSLILSRNPNLSGAGFTGNTYGSTDKPFRSYSAGIVPAGDTQYALGLGINDTLFRNNLFQSNLSLDSTDNPYMKNELLSKIFNNVTTRSNVFAVWLTVGFFEVTDDTVTPARLGKEIGRNEGRHIRHRMFAMIDRSNMLIPATLTTFTAAVAAGTQTVKVGALSGTSTLTGNSVIGSTSWGTHNTTMNWIIQPGTSLIVDQGVAGSEEVIVVTATGANTITANFVNAHNAGAIISVYGSAGPTVNGTPTVHGYPGPQPRFNPRNNTGVVPYFSVIQ